MNFIFKGTIGSSEELPIQVHDFTLKESSNCFKLKINTEEKMWLQIFLWDKKQRLILQYLHLKEESMVDVLNNNTCILPGVLEKGEYTLELFGVSNNKIAYEIELEQAFDIWADNNFEDERLYLNRYEFDKKHNREKRWYKGDFHTHTTLSDGKQTQIELMQQAEKMKLDFFVATDHNSLPTKWVRGNALVIPGMEITPLNNHFNAIGLRKWIDFRVSSKDGGLATEEGMNRLLKEARKNGALCSINHPELKPWQWSYLNTPIESIDTMEIINDPTFLDNLEATEKALKLWDCLWNEGYHIWGIGGSDSHLLPTERYEGATKPSLIGDPGTYVFADSLSAQEIINAVKNGKIYVSRYPELSIEIYCDGESYLPGDDLTSKFLEEISGKEIVYNISFKGIDEKSELSFIENGNTIKSILVEDLKDYSISFKWTDKAYTWNRIELRNASQELLLFTNPIYKGYRKYSIFNWGELKGKVGGH